MLPLPKGSNALTTTGTGSAVVPAEKKKKSAWARIATRYGAAWRLLLIATLLFAILFVLLFSRSFTYDSVLCFFEDLQAAAHYYPGDYATVYATFAEGESAALSYRGGIAFVNTAGIEVYSPNGARSLNVAHRMETPRALASRKYLLAFDHGKNEFVVTNSYAELYRGSTERPILGASVADDGHFALITVGASTLSEVLVFDNNFNLVARFSRASATVGVSISDNGRTIAILGATAEQGGVRGVVDVFAMGETEPEASLSLEGEMPLAVSFTDNNSFTVLTDRQLLTYRQDGTLRAEHAVEGDIVAFSSSEEGTLLVTSTSTTSAVHRVLLLDERGKIRYAGELSGDVFAVAQGKDEVFFLHADSVMRLDVKEESKTHLAIEKGATGLIAAGEGAVRVTYPAKAQHLSFE